MASPAQAHTSRDDEDFPQLEHGPHSPVDPKEENTRMPDQFALLAAEQAVNEQEALETALKRSQTRRHAPPPEDEFNTTGPSAKGDTQPIQAHDTRFKRFWKRLKQYPRFLRFFLYMTPPGIILLIPILIDLLQSPGDSKSVGGSGGLRLLWFGIWLEIIWLSLWASRIMTSILPWILGTGAKAFDSSNHVKWKRIGREVDIPAALFIWTLALLCSFRPITDNHRVSSGDDSSGVPYVQWIEVMYKVLLTIFVLATLNLVEKGFIRWIAFSFHLRTYAQRIDENERNLASLVRLYEYARNKSPSQVDEAGNPYLGGASGAKTPLQHITRNAREAWQQVGLVANRMAGDLTGRKVMANNHPRKIVLELLRDTAKSNTLARTLFRVFSRDGFPLVQEDLRDAFDNDEDTEACFAMFDRDLNADVSMEEMEHACNEIHLEIKAISMSLKDLDSVIKKLDTVFLVIICIIAAIVFVSIYSGSAAAALGTSGTTILGLSWMLQATAQEFLQSIIFVFVKHPFDVGDRVTIYGNTGSLGRSDDYYVQEISLLYTEFKKMEGHIVQAPNSLLNTLFILNQRRSPNLADPIELKVAFGTSAEAIKELEIRMTDFLLENKRDYTSRIITEVRTIDEVYSVTINFIFFHKSNFQNELLRLQRHNKFAAELMKQMKELNIQGPRRMAPGGIPELPFYYASAPAPPFATNDSNNPDFSRPAPSSSPSSSERTCTDSKKQPQDGHGNQHSHQSRQQSLAIDTQPRPQHSQPSYTPLSPSRRQRAESAAQLLDNGPSFGDVSTTRKDTQAVNRDISRLQSIREIEGSRMSFGGGSTASGRRGSVGEHYRASGASLEHSRTNATTTSSQAAARRRFWGVGGGNGGGGGSTRSRGFSLTQPRSGVSGRSESGEAISGEKLMEKNEDIV